MEISNKKNIYKINLDEFKNEDKTKLINSAKNVIENSFGLKDDYIIEKNNEIFFYSDQPIEEDFIKIRGNKYKIIKVVEKEANKLFEKNKLILVSDILPGLGDLNAVFYYANILKNNYILKIYLHIDDENKYLNPIDEFERKDYEVKIKTIKKQKEIVNNLKTDEYEIKYFINSDELCKNLDPKIKILIAPKMINCLVNEFHNPKNRNKINFISELGYPQIQNISYTTGLGENANNLGIYFDEMMYNINKDDNLKKQYKKEILNKYFSSSNLLDNIYLYYSNGEEMLPFYINLINKLSKNYKNFLFIPNYQLEKINSIIRNNNLENNNISFYTNFLEQDEFKKIIICCNLYVVCTGDMSVCQVLSVSKFPLYDFPRHKIEFNSQLENFISNEDNKLGKTYHYITSYIGDYNSQINYVDMNYIIENKEKITNHMNNITKNLFENYNINKKLSKIFVLNNYVQSGGKKFKLIL